MSIFKFQKFDIEQNGCAQKVGTDSMVLGAFVDYDNPKRVLDIGTGNGILALMMAQKFETAQIMGVEIQKECSYVALSNFKNSEFYERLSIVNADVKDYSFKDKFDLIVSNPPFFENDMISSNMERTTARHQSSLTLGQLINVAANNLNVDGSIWLIVAEESSKNLIEKSLEHKLKLSRKISVYGKPFVHKRDILVFVKTKESIDFIHEEFTIRTSTGEYTDEYKSKTIDFHHSRL